MKRALTCCPRLNAPCDALSVQQQRRKNLASRCSAAGRNARRPSMSRARKQRAGSASYPIRVTKSTVRRTHGSGHRLWRPRLCEGQASGVERLPRAVSGRPKPRPSARRSGRKPTRTRAARQQRAREGVPSELQRCTDRASTAPGFSLDVVTGPASLPVARWRCGFADIPGLIRALSCLLSLAHGATQSFCEGK